MAPFNPMSSYHDLWKVFAVLVLQCLVRVSLVCGSPGCWFGLEQEFGTLAVLPSYGAILRPTPAASIKLCEVLPGCAGLHKRLVNYRPRSPLRSRKITAVSKVAQDDFLNFHCM